MVTDHKKAVEVMWWMEEGFSMEDMGRGFIRLGISGSMFNES